MGEEEKCYIEQPQSFDEADIPHPRMLFRRGDTNEDMVDDSEYTIGDSLEFNFSSFDEFPGWVAFDIKCDVKPNDDNSVSNAFLKILIKNAEDEDFREVDIYKAGWNWYRVYVYCQVSESHTLRFETHDYKDEDEAYVRHFFSHFFYPVSGLGHYSITELQLPEPQQEVVPIETLSGHTIYQQPTLKKGVNIDFTLVFEKEQDYIDFMKNLISNYILKTPEGFFGGMLLPQETEARKLGPIYLVRTRLHSHSLPGKGHKYE